MFLFYSYKIEDATAHFDEVEKRHCINVLRKTAGDEILFTDGVGHHYEGRILSSYKKGFLASILSRKELPIHPLYPIHVAIAPTKNIDRFEWFLEKVTEFGVTSITPLICANSERKKIRPDRLHKILLSAVKQSFGAYLPKLNEAIHFDDFMKNAETALPKKRFIAHCRSNELPHLMDNSSSTESVVVLIGPEGDFSKEEINKAEEKRFQSISLGTSRLRTETAGIAAVHILNLKNQK